MLIEINQRNYQKEKDIREKRIQAYAEEIQNSMLNHTEKIVRDLVAERHRQGLTQQEIAEITGMRTSNIARFESGSRIPTLLVLQKYAGALGMHIELQICDGVEDQIDEK